MPLPSRSLALLGALSWATSAAAQPPPVAPSKPPLSPAEIESVARKYNLDGVLDQILSENIRRLRRATVFGPHAGLSGAFLPGTSTTDAGVSGGLGLYFFRVPLTVEIPDTVKASTRARLAEKLRTLAEQGAPPTPDDALALGRQIFEDTRDEFLGRRPRKPETFEKPIAGLYLDVARQFRSESWQLRVVPSFAISHLNLGLILGGNFGDRTGGILGGEASVRLLPGDGPRSPMFEPFFRYERVFSPEGSLSQLSLGLRLALDVI